jgi:hypothetical protein
MDPAGRRGDQLCRITRADQFCTITRADQFCTITRASRPDGPGETPGRSALHDHLGGSVLHDHQGGSALHDHQGGSVLHDHQGVPPGWTRRDAGEINFARSRRGDQLCTIARADQLCTITPGGSALHDRQGGSVLHDHQGGSALHDHQGVPPGWTRRDAGEINFARSRRGDQLCTITPGGSALYDHQGVPPGWTRRDTWRISLAITGSSGPARTTEPDPLAARRPPAEASPCRPTPRWRDPASGCSRRAGRPAASPRPGECPGPRPR